MTVLDCKFQAADSGSQEPNSLSVESEFLVRILDSKSQDSGLHKQTFLAFRNRDYRSGFIPQDHLDHGPSKKPMTPFSDGVNISLMHHYPSDLNS